MCLIYLDHNIVDDISKGAFELPSDSSFGWVYSKEHFAEIERAGDTRFLDVLRDLKALQLELMLDDRFRLSGEARLLGEVDPHAAFASWRAARANVPASGEYFSAIVSRLFGAANDEAIAQAPDAFEREVGALLQSAGLLDQAHAEAIATARDAMRSMVTEHLAERPHLESQREAFGTHNGRGSNLADHDNPLEECWRLVCESSPELTGAVTADQFFGFEPAYETGYERWPLYLGIVGCYTMLNMIGLRPDEKLSRVERMPAIMSDASHVGHAAYCQGLLSADRRLCDKAKAIYRFKGIGTQVLRLERRAAN